MSNDAILVLECLFGTIWSLFTSWHIPGTDITPAVMFLFLASAGIGLRFVFRFLNTGGGVSASGAARAQRSLARYHNRGVGRSMN